jgi:8-oxo-dGTP diphosphatase
MEGAKRSGINRYVVAAIITRNSEVLLLRRPESDFMGGIYELPSGKVEEDESLGDALYREVEEETGLKVKKIGRHLGHFDYESKGGEVTRQFNFAVEVEETMKIELTEHEQYLWYGKDDLSNHPVTSSVRRVLFSFWNTTS